MAKEALYNIIPDYSMPGISDPAIATIVAGILGVIIVFGLAYGIGRARKNGRMPGTALRGKRLRDLFTQKRSFVHQIDARVKVIFTLAFVIF